MSHNANHRCTFKLPKNSRYQCPKPGDMFQPHLNSWYCKFHDSFAKDRCQVFAKFEGAGIQCTELATLRNARIGRNYCEKHDPSRAGESVEGREKADGQEEQELVEAREKIPLTQPSTRSTSPQPSLEDSVSSTTPSTYEPTHSEAILSTPSSPIAPHFIVPEIEPSHDGAPPLKLRPPTFLNSIRNKVESDGQERIAALYLQCNVCLEKHNAADMHRIEPCGHQYLESCLRTVLGNGNIRRYNCSSCKAWMDKMRRGRDDP